MTVAISVPGRFHLFDLAKQLLTRGWLSQLITSYPKFEAAKYGIPRDKIHSLVLKEVIQRGWQKLPLVNRFCNPQFLALEVFDKAAARALCKSDIFVGASSASLHTLDAAKRFGAKGIVERGGAHILYQDKILKEEYEMFVVRPEPFQLPHPKVVEKELREYERANFISVPSRFVKQTFLDAGVPEEKLIHIPYGVDLSDFKSAPKIDNVFRVIFAGGVTLQKGAHYLLRAFSELNLPNAELVLAGGVHSEMKPFLKQYEGHYKLAGHLSRRELAHQYAQSSVFVLNSIHDGFGMVILQAMACGLPVVATENTGAPDIVREGKDGFIIPIRDTDALKAKLLYLYENPQERERMGHSAHERVSQGFTWDDYGSNMAKAYERILSNRP
jgi:glycosyltransferase involved in cell wall biosynthesis